ncbi:MAG TPA: hypothetical protein VFO19_08810, partial [Vicinamibacterales bacterium]|nr:hypothetical protein [Vicinamibacterales bacterium]
MDQSYFARVEEAAAVIRGRIGTPAAVAVVLGTGLGAFGDTLADRIEVPYGDIPHWPASRVIGHAGRLVAGTSGRTRV